MNIKNKILLIWFREYPWDVRIEKIAQSLVNYGFEVEILCRWKGEQYESEILNGISIFRMGFGKQEFISAPFYRNLFWRKAIGQRLDSFKPDIVIVRDMHLAGMTVSESHKRKIPVVMDMAEHYPGAMREWRKYNNSALKRFLMHKYRLPDKIEKYAVRNIDGIITVCDEQVVRMKKQYGMKDSQLTVVHNTPPMNIYNNNDNRKNNQNLKLFHHGYLTSEKSLMKFIEGFILVADKTDIRFEIAGDGENYNEYLSLIKRNSLENRIAMTGAYDFANLNEMLSHIDIGVIPYQINEFNEHTIHNKIFDYFAAGKPVITSEAAPLKRIVGESYSGIAINCENPQSVAEFLLNINNYDWHNMAQNAHKAYREKYNWQYDEKVLNEFLQRYL